MLSVKQCVLRLPADHAHSLVHSRLRWPPIGLLEGALPNVLRHVAGVAVVVHHIREHLGLPLEAEVVLVLEVGVLLLALRHLGVRHLVLQDVVEARGVVGGCHVGLLRLH